MLGEMKVLLVADDQNIRGLEEVLNGYTTVQRIQTVPELGASLRQCDWDIVISDWSLGNESWKHVVVQTRGISPNLPVVVCCHCGGLAEWIEVLTCGAFDLVVPPYTPGSVLPALEQAAESRRARDRLADFIGAVAKRS
jgi:DNA-binding NtrC family response regulator